MIDKMGGLLKDIRTAVNIIALLLSVYYLLYPIWCSPYPLLRRTNNIISDVSRVINWAL